MGNGHRVIVCCISSYFIVLYVYYILFLFYLWFSRLVCISTDSNRCHAVEQIECTITARIFAGIDSPQDESEGAEFEYQIS